MGLFSRATSWASTPSTCSACGHGSDQPNCNCSNTNCVCNPSTYQQAYGHPKPTK